MIHSKPELIDIPPDLLERLEKFRVEHEGDPIGDVATSVLFEDDKVRIWEMKLKPGEHSDLHRHDHDYYLAIFSGDLVAGVPPVGKGDIFLARVPPEGNTVAIAKGSTEWAYNVGDTTYHEILIELKQT